MLLTQSCRTGPHRRTGAAPASTIGLLTAASGSSDAAGASAVLRSSAAQARGAHEERSAGPAIIRCRSASEGRLRIMSATLRSGLTGAEKSIRCQRASRVPVPPRHWIGRGPADYPARDPVRSTEVQHRDSERQPCVTRGMSGPNALGERLLRYLQTITPPARRPT